MRTPRPARHVPTGRATARPAAAGALALALLPALAGPAAAHTALAGSSPATGSSVEAAPGQVELVFTEAVSPDLATVVVTAPDGGPVGAGDPAVDGTTVTQPLADPSGAGQYRVAYRVVAADGHPVTGTVSFSVTGAPAPSTASGVAPALLPGSAEPAPGPSAAPSAGSASAPGEPLPEEPLAATPVAPESSAAPWLLASLVVAAFAGLAAAVLARRRGRAASPLGVPPARGFRRRKGSGGGRVPAAGGAPRPPWASSRSTVRSPRSTSPARARRSRVPVIGQVGAHGVQEVAETRQVLQDPVAHPRPEPQALLAAHPSMRSASLRCACSCCRSRRVSRTVCGTCRARSRASPPAATAGAASSPSSSPSTSTTSPSRTPSGTSRSHSRLGARGGHLCADAPAPGVRPPAVGRPAGARSECSPRPADPARPTRERPGAGCPDGRRDHGHQDGRRRHRRGARKRLRSVLLEPGRPHGGAAGDRPAGVRRAVLGTGPPGGPAGAHRRSARGRRPGPPAARVQAARRVGPRPRVAPRRGRRDGPALVEVVADDQAFLVDSVRLAISRLGLGVDLVVHPVVRALRDPAGWLRGVLRPRDPGPEAIPESYIRVELEVETDPAALAGLEREVTRVLRDVHLVNRDWAAMRDTTRRLAGGLASEPLPVDADDVEEARALLDWMSDDHFVFLGYREYRLGRAEGEDVLEALPQTGLGLLAPRLPQLTAEQRAPLAQPLRSLPPSARRMVAAPDLLLVTKANARSTVLRGTRLDYLGVKRFDDTGRVVGERRILGLFTSAAYRLSPRQVPLLRRKVAAIERLGGFAPDSHDANRLADVLDTLPRTELFQASTAELAEIAFGVLGLQERRRVRLLVRPDAFGRFVSCLVHLPRDRYATGVRVRVQELLRQAYSGTAVDYDTSLTESALARLHVIVHLPDGTDEEAVRAVDVRRLEAEVAAATRSWDDELAAALVAAHGETAGGDLARRYRGAFGPGYQDDVAPADAVVDVERLERLERLDPAGDLQVVLRRPVGDVLPLRLYRAGGGLALSDVLPLLHDAGVSVLEARPHEVHRREPEGAGAAGSGAAGSGLAPAPRGGVWVHDLHLRHPGSGVLPREVATAFEEVLTRAWRGQADSDGFTRLVLAAGLSAREVDLVRAYGRYLRQTASTYSQDYQEDALAAHPHVVRLLVDLFAARTDPSWRRSQDGAAGAAAEAERLEAEVRAALDRVESLDEDRILRSFLGLVLATLRTTWWQRDAAGRPPEAVVLKLDSPRVPDLPEPRPYVEVWVHSPRVEGVHLRGGPVARGGLRWSDRREDFRAEVLGLMKAQMTKNAVIVPVGAKGGFVVKRPPAERAALVDEGVACYRTFVSGLLDLTDNLVEGRVVPPADVVRHDGDDPYLVVAADKGTATLSDTANGLADEHGFWLGDAFASGGSHGYDHKAMGITARGAWVSARRHGLELGFDTQSEDFTVVGVGDMSGDVFGNGMLLSRHLRLVAAFDHRHVFLDPEPDAATSYDERARLFALPRSSWADYDAELISEGGGVWPRTAKSIPVSPQVRAALGLPDTTPDALAPTELMRAVLAAPVDMLWNGGVGTYVKAATETHADAGDKANDAIRVDGRDLRARMVVEGGNLGLTQRGRIEYARSGGLVNTDAIDNSAGVDCSDHEVNIKVLLRAALDDGALAPEDRDPLLAAMTDEVARLVLADNDGQTRALSNARAQAAGMVDVHRRYLRVLEGAGVVSRALEALPTDDELVERSAAGQGLVGPEFAVLLAYTKTRLYAELLDSDVPEDPWLGRQLVGYFPTLLRERFVPQMGSHRLRREIIATSVANELVNRQGTTFAFRLGEETGARAADITRAFTVAREVFGMASLWDEVEGLDGLVGSDVQVALFLRARTLVERATRWLLRARPTPLDIAATVDELAPVAAIADALPSLLGTLAAEQTEQAEANDVAAGVPVHVARRVAVLPMLVGALDVVDVARAEGAEPLEAARVYYALGDRLRLDWLRRQVVELPRRDRWQTLARAAVRDDYYAVRRQLTGEVLATGGVEEWDRAARPRIDRFLRLLADIEARGATDLAALSVALRGARTLAEGPRG